MFSIPATHRADHQRVPEIHRLIRSLQPTRIRPVRRPVADVPIEVPIARLKPDRIGTDELAGRGIVVAGAVVVEIGFGVEVAAGEGEAGFCRGGSRGPNSAESVVTGSGLPGASSMPRCCRELRLHTGSARARIHRPRARLPVYLIAKERWASDPSAASGCPLTYRTDRCRHVDEPDVWGDASRAANRQPDRRSGNSRSSRSAISRRSSRSRPARSSA